MRVPSTLAQTRPGSTGGSAPSRSDRTHPALLPGNRAANSSGYRATSARLRAVARTTQHERDPRRPVWPAQGRQCHRLVQLPIRAPRGSPDIADRVPALNDEEPAAGVVHERDVDAASWIRGAGPELDLALVAVRTGQPQDQLLEHEVAGVGRLLQRVAAEGHHEWHAEREPDALPGVDRQAAAESALRAADRRTTQPNPATNGRLRQRSSQACRASRRAERGELLAPAYVRLDGELGSATARHDRTMLIPGAYPPLSRLRLPVGGCDDRPMRDRVDKPAPRLSIRVARRPGRVDAPGMHMRRAPRWC